MKKIISTISVGLIFFTAFAMAKPSGVQTKQKTASSKDMPSWVKDPSSLYNTKRYLTGVGSGTDDAAAVEDAKAQLISTLRQDISATITLKTTDDSKTTTSFLTQDIETTTQVKNLSGVEIAEKYYSPDSRVYMLAVLNRQQAAESYAKNISGLNEKIAEYLKYAEANPKDIQSVIYAQKSLSLASEIEYYKDIISALNAPSGVNVSICYQSFVSLEQKTAEIKKQVPIHTIIEGDVKGMAEASVKKSIEKLGLIAQDGDLPACPYSLLVSIDVEKADISDEKHSFYNYSYTIELIGHKKDSYFVYSTSGRAGHLNDQGAKNKAMLLITKDIESKFYEKLAGYIENGSN